MATACGQPGEGADGTRGSVQRVLDQQAAAVREGDERRFLAAVDSGAEEYRTRQRVVFRNLRKLPLAELSHVVDEVSGVHRTGGPRTGQPRVREGESVTARVRLRYRLSGYDTEPVIANERLTFVRRADRWYLHSEAPGSRSQLWEQGELSVVEGDRSLVLGVGAGRASLKRFTRVADGAVRAVNRSWPRQWPGRMVLEAPRNLRDMARLLDGTPETYQGIAAVTTGTAESDRGAPADRVVVNPEAYGLLGPSGRRSVLTHEAVHVATRAHTTSGTPLWLSEGVADWVGYRGSGRTATAAAPVLTRFVRGADGVGGAAPARLPGDRAFRFGRDPEALGRAYEGGWLACRMIAERWGERRLIDLYLTVGEGERPEIDRALREVLGIGEAEFTERWRAYVEDELG
ncbi:hypothetical protein E0L36_05040 [Streptomyces sp. AJS327]|nr:hypothetical protein [Streptomyces sp. AJS327]